MSTVTEPKVSIIVPVYNTERYLAECLDSILAQTLSEIEVICVDDGSTDSSPQILDEYAKKDERVHVIHKKNQGYGHSINVGMDSSTGKYIGIVESDDSVLKNMYECLYASAEDNALDLVKTDCYFCWDSIGYRIPRHFDHLDQDYNRVIDSSERDLYFRFFMNTWSGIYRRSFLLENNIRHHESPGASFQDNGFWMQTMYLAKRAMWINKPLYLYRLDNESASTHSVDKALAMLNEYKWLLDILHKKGFDDSELTMYYYYRLFRHKGTMLRIDDEIKKELYPEILEDYKNFWKYMPDLVDDVFFKWYTELSGDPEGFCDRLIEGKNRIKSILDKADSIWIMGSGLRGQRIMRLLHMSGYHDRINGFVITGIAESSRIGTFPVYNINDPQVDLSSGIVAMGAKRNSRSYNEMKEELTQRSVYSFIDCEDLTENLYWIY